MEHCPENSAGEAGETKSSRSPDCGFHWFISVLALRQTDDC
jgi:hypothetical protein